MSAAALAAAVATPRAAAVAVVVEATRLLANRFPLRLAPRLLSLLVARGLEGRLGRLALLAASQLFLEGATRSQLPWAAAAVLRERLQTAALAVAAVRKTLSFFL